MERAERRFGLFENLLSSRPKQLWRRYVFAIGLIISLLLGSHVAHVMTLKEAAQDANIINLSGRQRMLSQRILYLTSELSAENGQYASPLLEDAIRQFESAHNTLLSHASQASALSDHYAATQEGGLDHATRQFIGLTRTVLNERGENVASIEQLRELGAFSILRELNEAVELFEEQAELRGQNLRAIQEATLMLAILTIIIEGVLIFWPAQVSINRALTGLDLRNQEILETNRELADLAEKMTHAASHDQLTGIATRKRLEDELEERLASDSGQSLCLMHIDLDRFKEVNDTLGHPVGDRVIQHCANIMALTIRDEDMVARVGGDEFIVVLDLPKKRASRKATEIADCLIKRITEPFEIEGNKISIGASIGIAFWVGGEDSMTLIGNADIALYQAKNEGRGISCLFNEEMRKEMEHRHSLSQDLKRAAEKDQFEPYFQPQVQFSDGHLVGFECLARWEHPLRGTLSPGKFIDLGRELGLIHLIDKQILQKSLDALVTLRASGWKIPTISVNFDAFTLRQTGIVEWLESSLREAGIPASDLVVEVTESVFIEGEHDPAVGTLNKLRKLGVNVHLDDFGTGYSSLSYLVLLDLNGVKIDRSLVQHPTGKRSSQVIRAISNIAHGLDLTIVAEGIEDPKQFRALQELNCGVAQGFGIGVPQSLTDIESWLKSYGKSGDALLQGPYSC